MWRGQRSQVRREREGTHQGQPAERPQAQVSLTPPPGEGGQGVSWKAGFILLYFASSDRPETLFPGGDKRSEVVASRPAGRAFRP